MSDETKKWVADIDAELAEAAEARLEWGERKNAIETLAELIANDGLSERTPYDTRIRQLKRKRDQLVSERDSLNVEISDIEDELESLRETRSSFESAEDRIEGAIESVESNLRHAGMNVYEKQPAVKDIAKKHGLTTEAVVSRIMERNPDVPPHAFSHPNSEDYFDSWDGFESEEKANTPPESREEVYGHET